MHLTANTGEASGAMTNIREEKIDALEEGLSVKLDALQASQTPPSASGPDAAPN